MTERPNLAALAGLAAGPFDGRVWRAVLNRHQDRILSTEGNRYFDGRYHRAGETGILYSSCEPETAAAEVKRHASVEQMADGLVIGEIKIRLAKVLDLTQDAALDRLGLTREILIGPDFTPTQALSLQARRLGIQGLLVPSAAGQGANLIVFEDNLGEGCAIAVENVRPVSD